MDKLILLTLTCIAYLCAAGIVHYNGNEFAISGSEVSKLEESEVLPCGRIMSPIGPEFSIVPETSDGTDFKYTDYPWMVAMFATTSKNEKCALTNNSCWSFKSGGLLIGPMVALLSGKYVYLNKQHKLKVRAGGWNLDTLEDRNPYQDQFVNRFIIDNRRGFDGHAALLIMESPFTLTDNIAFICLPPPDFNDASVSCKVANSGMQLVTETGTDQARLKVVDLNYMDHEQCERILRKGNYQHNFVLPDNFMCAGGGTQDKCAYREGSLLMCIVEDHYYVRGINAGGYNCSADYPETFIDVVKMRNWIDKEIRNSGFTTDTYSHSEQRYL